MTTGDPVKAVAPACGAHKREPFGPLAMLFGRFSSVGALCTFASYAFFVPLAAVTSYVVANALAWIAGATLGFALNRRFTFGLRGRAHMRQDAALFALGSIGQFAVGSLGFWLLIGIIGLPPVLAFPLNLAFTIPPMFLFLRFVAFRRARSAGSS
jgi:putative flippase GtrA